MSALAQFQRALAAHVLSGAACIEPLILGGADFDRRQRLEVYRSAYGLRLTETLATDFPALRALLGADVFDALARAYIAAQPSSSFTLRDFGHALADFVGRRWRRQPWLRELAAFEWALGCAFDGPDATALAQADLAAIPPARFARLRLRCQPGMGLLRQRWDVPALWNATQAGQQPTPQRHTSPAHCLVWRRELRVYFRTLDMDEATLLRALRAGRTFAGACSALAAVTPTENPALRAAGLLTNWINEALLVAD